MPSKTIDPEVGSISLQAHRASVDFPQPDSPTNPRTSPGYSWRLTQSTALMTPDLANAPAGNSLDKSRISRRGRIPRTVHTPLINHEAAQKHLFRYSALMQAAQ